MDFSILQQLICASQVSYSTRFIVLNKSRSHDFIKQTVAKSRNSCKISFKKVKLFFNSLVNYFTN